MGGKVEPRALLFGAAPGLCVLALALSCGEEQPFVLSAEHYEGWEDGDEGWAEGGEVVVVDSSHEGWGEARCFECHGVGAAAEVVGHDPRMQYWSWSCSRGFPGGTACHGHGVNGGDLFNHGDDPFFTGCTQVGCHDLYDAGVKDRENHGFMDAPDLFCEACHDPSWESWPE